MIISYRARWFKKVTIVTDYVERDLLIAELERILETKEEVALTPNVDKLLELLKEHEKHPDGVK